MALPWLRLLDTVLGLTDLAVNRRPRESRGTANDDAQEQLAPPNRALGYLETRLAGVVVGALKEAFDRDSRRLEFEREQIEAEQRRAELMLKLELLRQAGEREIGRMRLVAAVAVATWTGTLFFSTRFLGGGVAPRVTLGAAWALLIAALAAAFAAQSRVARTLTRLDVVDAPDVSSGAAGAIAPWLIIAGLALVALTVLV